VAREVDAKKATITRRQALDVLDGVDECTRPRAEGHPRRLEREKPDRATLEGC